MRWVALDVTRAGAEAPGTHVEAWKQGALTLPEAFAQARDARLLYLSAFASDEVREQFMAGRRDSQDILRSFTTGASAQVADISGHTLAQLMEYYLRTAPWMSVAEEGAMLQAIHNRETQALTQKGQAWKTAMEWRGGQRIHTILQNLYLAAAERRIGVCSAIAAHVAALALNDVAGGATQEYFRKLAAAIQSPGERSAQVLGLGLLEWSLFADELKFASQERDVYQSLGAVAEEIATFTPETRALEVSAGRHAIAVGRFLREGKAVYFLADATYGYSEFTTKQAFVDGMRFHETLFRQLEHLDTTASFTARTYRTDLVQQPLFQGQRVEATHPNIMRVLDLGAKVSLAARFNDDTPLENDARFKQIKKRLSRAEYQLTLADREKIAPGTSLATLIERILVKHGQAPGVLSHPSQEFALRFEGEDALVVLKSSAAGSVETTVRISGQRFSADVASLRQYQQFFDTMVSAPRSLLSQWFKPKPTLTIETVYLAHALSPGGLISVGELAAIESAQQTPAAVSPVSLIPLDDAQLERSRAEQEAQRYGAALTVALRKLGTEAELKGWVPLLDTLSERKENGRTVFDIQVISAHRPGEPPVTLSTEDTTFKTFKDYFGRLRSRLLERAPTEPVGVDGLNSAFAIQALLRYLREGVESGDSDAEAKGNLALALRIQGAVNIVQLGVAGGHDLTQVLAVARAVLTGGENSTTVADSLLSLSSGLLSKVGLGLQAAGIGLDITALIQAKTEAQRAQFATRLAFDSTGLGLMGASVLGVEAAGPLGVAVAGLGIGVTALVDVYEEVAQRAVAVGAYIAQLKTAYETDTETESGAYRFDATLNALIPVGPAVLGTINLREQSVSYSSPQLYRTRHGSTGSGEINYFFWAGDAPTVVVDPDQALDIREGLGIKAQGKLPNAGINARTLILPGMPKAYLRYSYNTLPGATTRHDPGFDLWRKLEVGRKFDFDFYVFPGEYIVVILKPDYANTEVPVLLNETIERIEIPPLADELQGFLHYKLSGLSRRYVLGLQPGVRLSLRTDNADGTEWVLDARGQGAVSVSFEGDSVRVAGTEVKLLDSPQAQGGGRSAQTLYLLQDEGKMSCIDLSARTVELVQLDVSQWGAQDANLKARVPMIICGSKITRCRMRQEKRRRRLYTMMCGINVSCTHNVTPMRYWPRRIKGKPIFIIVRRRLRYYG